MAPRQNLKMTLILHLTRSLNSLAVYLTALSQKISILNFMEELGMTEILTEDEHFIQVGMGFRKIP